MLHRVNNDSRLKICVTGLVPVSLKVSERCSHCAGKEVSRTQRCDISFFAVEKAESLLITGLSASRS